MDCVYLGLGSIICGNFFFLLAIFLFVKTLQMWRRT